MSNTKITYKSNSVDDRRAGLIEEMCRLEEDANLLKRDLRAVSSNSEARREFADTNEFRQFVAGIKHKLAVIKVERVKIRNQIARCKRIIRNRDAERRNSGERATSRQDR